MGDISFRAPRILRLFFAGMVVALLVLQIYALVVSRVAGSAHLPLFFGNRPEVIQALPVKSAGEAFTFAVLGDTKSLGTFERLAGVIRKAAPDFVVLLGDCVLDATEAEHAFFRTELANEINFGRPTFYLPGNHDVRETSYPVARFEQTYGPSNFSFVYGQSLFIGLRILDPPYSNAESLAFLRSLAQGDLAQYRHRFLMMHIPPPVSPDFKVREYPASAELLTLIDQLDIDYVLAGDFHGYCRAQIGRTHYIVTGGGGARLNKKFGTQFHHAVLLRVAPDAVSERLLVTQHDDDWEDKLEHAAITGIAPLLERHPWAALLIDLLLLLVGWKTLMSRRKQSAFEGNHGA